jgi:hypothetical protein
MHVAAVRVAIVNPVPLPPLCPCPPHPRLCWCAFSFEIRATANCTWRTARATVTHVRGAQGVACLTWSSLSPCSLWAKGILGHSGRPQRPESPHGSGLRTCRRQRPPRSPFPRRLRWPPQRRWAAPPTAAALGAAGCQRCRPLRCQARRRPSPQAQVPREHPRRTNPLQLQLWPLISHSLACQRLRPCHAI